MSSEHLFWGQGNENYSNAIIKMRPAGRNGVGVQGDMVVDFFPVLSFVISGEFSGGAQKISSNLHALSTGRLETASVVC